MKLPQFSVIVAVDLDGGIAKSGNIPWHSQEDMRFFRDTTVGPHKGKNVIIMGRITYESLPKQPLPDRHNVVISRTWKQEDHPEILVFGSLLAALSALTNPRYNDIFVVGGVSLYEEAVRDFGYLCKRVYVTKFKHSYSCDQFFPLKEVENFPLASEPQRTRDYTRFIYAPVIEHEEYRYLNLLQEILENGEKSPDRTGVGTLRLSGKSLEFDISQRIPLFTTKRVFYEAVIKELLFFISGKTNTKILEEQKVNIWKGNTSKEFIKERGLDYDEGDMGAGYPHHWRHYGAPYIDCHTDYTGQGIDQLQNVINSIRKDPYSRRHLVSAWDPLQNDKACLPACHYSFQFLVGPSQDLDCIVSLRSNDCFLGNPFNVASYAFLTYMVAHICDLKPRKLRLNIADAHIYANHQEAVRTQLGRTPHPFPTLQFRRGRKIRNIDDFTLDDFIITGYEPCPAIHAPMAI